MTIDPAARGRSRENPAGWTEAQARGLVYTRGHRRTRVRGKQCTHAGRSGRGSDAIGIQPRDRLDNGAEVRRGHVPRVLDAVVAIDQVDELPYAVLESGRSSSSSSSGSCGRIASEKRDAPRLDAQLARPQVALDHCWQHVAVERRPEGALQVGE